MITNFKNVNDLITYSKKGIFSKVLHKNNGLDSTLFCMAKGTNIDDHTSTKQGIIYVLEGKGIFRLEGKNIKMEKGVIIHMDKNAVHSLKAKDDTSFLLILGDVK